MSISEDFLLSDDLHPIDLVETLAEHHEIAFDRIADDQIAMQVEGQWRSYALSLAWQARDEVLRLICTFEMDPPRHRLPAVLDVINRANDQVWGGAFTWWEEPRLMVWRYGLMLAGRQQAAPEQIEQMIWGAITASERFYPAFQLTAWGEKPPEEAIKVAIAETMGRA